MQELCILLKVRGDEVVPAVRQLITLAEQVDEVRARASDAALAIQILAQVEETLNSRVASAVTTSGGSPSIAKQGRSAKRQGSTFRVEPHDVIHEVQELVAFETRWLTDALVNREAKGLYEVLRMAFDQITLPSTTHSHDVSSPTSFLSIY